MRPIILFLLAGAACAQLRVNAGGPAITDALGAAWQADKYFSGGAISTGPIPGGAAQIYVTKRYGDFNYLLPVPDGSYTVALSFLENVVAPGERIFSVLLNGVLVLANYDVAADAGQGVATRKLFPALAAGGTGIRVSFVTLKRSAFVNAIEVTAAATAPTYLTGLASDRPAGCPAGPMGLYGSIDTGEILWCAAPGGWTQLGTMPRAATVVSFTSTQAVLAYEAPDATTACKVEASESPGYSPLVHDVDPVLFPGADLDAPGGLAGGTGRVVIVGKRRTDTAIDGHNYSRALQANTKHYVRISCGSGRIYQAILTTATIPAGATLNDGPQVDPDRPGQWKMPTRLEDRAQTIVDPQTGALLHAVSLDAESRRANGFNGIFMLYGGFVRMCAPKAVGPAGGPLGFLCSLVRYGQGGYVAYWIVPATGEVRMLGNLPLSQGGVFGPLGSDLRSYGPDNSGNTVWVEYTGNFKAVTTDQNAAVSGWNTYSSAPAAQLVHNFDPAFPITGFDCGRPWAAPGEHKLFTCGTGQDNPGWLAVLHEGVVVAAVNIYTAPKTENCTLHNVQQMGDVASINVQTAPAPRCAAMGHMVYWRFKTDPHGVSIVIDRFFDGGGHWDYGPLGRISEDGGGWAVVMGTPLEANLDRPLTGKIDDSPFFAGARGLSWGATTSKHPSYHQVAGVAPAGELGWLLDMLPFDGGQFYSPAAGATHLSGQLYKYNLSTEQPTAALARKQLPTLAASGGRALIDISGPGSRIGDTAADGFRYCVVLLPGECRPLSTGGDIFVNAPEVSSLQCAAADGPVPDRFDLCIGNMGAFSQAMVQVDVTGRARPRAITFGLAGIRNSFYYSTAKSLPDASWALFSWGVVKPGFGDLTNVWMAKLPPLIDDGVDRSTFVRMPVRLDNPPAGTVTAAVEFGYLENGPPELHYCTSRREARVATGTVTDANPFRYASEGIAGVACASSCTVTVPVIPGRIIYYRGVFYDSSGVRTGVGKDQVAAR